MTYETSEPSLSDPLPEALNETDAAHTDAAHTDAAHTDAAHTTVDIIAVSADPLEDSSATAAKSPIQEKIAEHFEQAKAESKTRAKRIQSIFQAAWVDAIAEVKGGSHQVWNISKGSIADVLEVEIAQASAQNVNPDITVTDAPVTDAPVTDVPVTDALPDEASPFWKSVLQAFQLKLQAYLKQESSTLPQRYSTIRKNAAEWDQELSQKYGDRYTSTKQILNKTTRSTWSKLIEWYRNNSAQTAASGFNPIERKQAELEVEVAVIGAKVAQKERELKQQVKDVVLSTLRAD